MNDYELGKMQVAIDCLRLDRDEAMTRVKLATEHAEAAEARVKELEQKLDTIRYLNDRAAQGDTDADRRNKEHFGVSLKKKHGE